MKAQNIFAVLFTIFSSMAVTSGCSSKSPELIPVSSFIIELQGIPDQIYSGETAVFTISYSDTAFELPRTVNQVPGSYKKDKFTTTVILETGRPGIMKKPDPGNFLSPTSYIDSADPGIKKHAAELKTGNNAVMDISRFVYNHIKYKKTGIPILPASVILQNCTGDCTEHSILTAALLLAADIPARCVMGVILCDEFRGKKNVFVYHMWVEAYYKGGWILVDSTRPDDIHMNRYIAFTYHSFTSETPMDYLEAVSALTDLTITVTGR